MRAKSRRKPKEGRHGIWVFVWVMMTLAILGGFVLGVSITPLAKAENPAPERVLMALAAAYVLASFPAKRWLLARAKETESGRLRAAALLVPWALCEVAAITGIALRLMIGSSHYYVFLLLGLAGMLLNFPKKES
jgi:hypothetical protein